MGNSCTGKKNKKFDQMTLISRRSSKGNLIINNYSMFLGKHNCFMDEPNLNPMKSVRVSNLDVNDLFDLDPSIIGRGQFGIVRKASLKSFSSKTYALKTINKSKANQNLNFVYREISLLSECDQPNIVRFFESFETEKEFHFQMELCTGSDLKEFILNESNRLEEYHIRKMFRQVLLAINHMHLRGICHRDIKPENFIFSDISNEASLKLVDFGYAKKFFGNNGKCRLYSLVGSPSYVAPEVLGGDYDEKCDNWSAGILLYYLATGTLPFSQITNMKLIFKKIISEEIDFKTPFQNKILSKEFFELLTGLLNRDEKSRFTIQQALSHSWFNDRIPPTIHSNEIEELMSNFEQFKMYNAFQKNIFKMYVRELAEIQIRHLHNLFEYIDRDLDGIISFPELKYFLVRKGLFKSNKDCLENIAHLHKTDNHHIFYTEFLASTISKEIILSQSNLKRLFNSLIMNEKDVLEFSVIENIYNSLGYKFKLSDLTDLIQLCGIKLKNMKGLYFDEFKILLNNDLEALTSDENELNSIRKNDIYSKNFEIVHFNQEKNIFD
jgi:calcium-dependent protein kinase